MASFVVRRLVSMCFVLFAVSVLVFLIFNVIPNGDPAVRMAGKAADRDADRGDPRGVGLRRAHRRQQYVTTMKKLFTGDMVSYFTQLNVTSRRS